MELPLLSGRVPPSLARSVQKKEAQQMTRQEKLDMVEQFGAAARASHRKYGVPASTTIAQAILESGWGQSLLAKKAKNFFGIKDTDFCEGYVEFKTREVFSGKETRVPARFEKYASVSLSFEHHARLLSESDRYQPAMAVADDPEKFALQLLACGYATDPKYPNLLKALIRQYNLTRFDAAEEAAKR